MKCIEHSKNCHIMPIKKLLNYIILRVLLNYKIINVCIYSKKNLQYSLTWVNINCFFLRERNIFCLMSKQYFILKIQVLLTSLVKMDNLQVLSTLNKKPY